MDAVGLPLPANVVVSKLLTAEGFGRGGEPEARGSAGADSSVLGSHKASGCSSNYRDKKYPVTLSEYSSISRNKKTDAELCMHENLLPSFKCEENGKLHASGEADRSVLLLPKQECRQLNRKPVEKLSSSPCSKRPRTDQPENSMTIAGAGDCDVISKKIGSDLKKCTSGEKSRSVKQKRGHDVKRTDKKNYRAGVKTKLDTFASKASLASSDSAPGGSNILGIYGLKSDLRDVTKHVDELSLNELLDGTYDYPNFCQEKGKKASHVNENILLMIRKAWSILPPHGAVDSSGNRKALTCLQSPNSCSTYVTDSDNRDIGFEQSVPFTKVQDPCQAKLNDSTLYQPKDILERLALSPAQDLDALLLDSTSSMPSVPVQCTESLTTFNRASLPPFPWSYPNSGPCKPNVDSGKIASSRTTCQGRWVRIGSNSSLIVDEHSCFSELDLKTYDQTEDPLRQRKIDDLLQDIDALTVSVRSSYDKQVGPSCAMARLPESHISDKIVLMKGSGILGSDHSFDVNLLDGHTDSLDRHLKFDSKEYVFLRTEDEGGMKNHINESSVADPSTFNIPFQESKVSHKELFKGSAHGCSDSCYCHTCRSTTGGSDKCLWNSPSPEISKPGHSPRLLTAAEILCEMASYSDYIRKRNDNSGKMRWPIGTNKSASSVEKTDGLFLATMHHDPIKSTSLPSVKHKLMAEKKNSFNHMNTVGRGPVRWSVPVEDTFPRKLERDLAVYPRPLHGNSARPSGMVPSPTRVEKGCDNQQKPRRTTVTTTSVIGGTYIKDWSRGRSKRV